MIAGARAAAIRARFTEAAAAAVLVGALEGAQRIRARQDRNERQWDRIPSNLQRAMWSSVRVPVKVDGLGAVHATPPSSS